MTDSHTDLLMLTSFDIGFDKGGPFAYYADMNIGNVFFWLDIEFS